MPGGDVAIGIHDIAPQVDPLARLIAGLFVQLALRAIEGRFALFKVAAHRGQELPLQGILALPEEQELALSGESRHVDKLRRDNPGPVFDHRAVGQLHSMIFYRQPFAAPEDHAPREGLPAFHRMRSRVGINRGRRRTTRTAPPFSHKFERWENGPRQFAQPSPAKKSSASRLNASGCSTLIKRPASRMVAAAAPGMYVIIVRHAA